jgi:hypothetical protein
MGNTRRSTQTAQTAQVEEQVQAEPTPEEVIAQLRAEQERLLAELEAEKAKPKRQPRERKMTPKQRRLVEFLRANPEATIAEACEAAGATSTSHGLVFRMIEEGYLLVRPPEEDAPAEESEGSGEVEDSAEESQDA